MKHLRSTAPKQIFIFSARQLALSCCMCFIAFTQLNAQAVFKKNQLHSVEIFCAEINWFDTLQTYYNAALNGAGNRFVSVETIIDGDTLHNVGMRFKGKYSNYGFPGLKKPLRLDFNEYDDDQRFQGLKKLNLHNSAGDPSFLREYMAYDLFDFLEIPAPHASFCKLYINGAYWGCYEIAEEPDNVFLKNNFGNKNGNLFECTGTTSLEWEGTTAAGYPAIELKTDSAEDSWDKLIHWIDVFNNNFDYDFQQQLSGIFDTETYLKILAVDVLINNTDAYSSNGRNFFIYDDPATKKLHWIPWDYNLSFWNGQVDAVPHANNSSWYQPLVYRIKENSYLHQQYLKSFCKLIDQQLSAYSFDDRSLAAYNLIKEAVESDTNKFYTNADFYANRTSGVTVNMLRNNQPTDVYLPGITTFFANQKNDLRRKILLDGCDCADADEADDDLHATVFPNPTAADVTIYMEEDVTNASASVFIYDLKGQLIYTEKTAPVAGSIRCNTSVLAQGAYIIQINALNKTTYTKLIKTIL